MRRRLCNCLPHAVILAASFAALPNRATEADEPLASAVTSVGMTVSDLEQSIAFYRDALDFEVVAQGRAGGDEFEQWTGLAGARARTAVLRLGDEQIDLIEFETPRGRPMPLDSRSNDHWFQHIAIIVSDMDAAYERLRRFKVRHVSSGPQRLPDWNKNAGGIRAFYFLDPDGHPLEILHFPPDKGWAKWHAPTDRLFLGIDHTAIVVSDTDQSLAFYRDRLGMKITGESENYGTEQEHLNNVFGARLRITALRAADGPGIELLEYLAPPGGRPRPDHAAVNDMMHWQTSIAVRDLNGAQAELTRIESPDEPPSPEQEPGRLTPATAMRQDRVRRMLIGDPDGHVFQLVSAGG